MDSLERYELPYSGKHDLNLIISYSRLDIKSARILKSALEKYGFNIWLDEQQMEFGQDIAERLKTEFARSDFVLLLITQHSLDSKWVQWELEYVLELEKQQGRAKVIPILMGGDKLPAKLALRHYSDFRTGTLMKSNFLKLAEQLLKAKKSKSKTIDPGFVFKNRVHVTTPVTGLFYDRHEREKVPLVEVGDRVTRGQVLCLVYSMKLFNQIQSPVNGEVVGFLVDHEQPVEMDQPLIVLEADE